MANATDIGGQDKRFPDNKTAYGKKVFSADPSRDNQEKKFNGYEYSPLRLMAIILASIFIAETFVMMFMTYFPVKSVQAEWLIDSLLLVALVSPVIYFLVVQPLVKYIEKQKRSEEKLRLAKEDAEAALLLKDKFVSLVSHDLRSPLASIMGLMRVLNADVVTPLNDDQKALLGHMMKTGDGLVNMIDKLLDIGKLKTGMIKPNLRFAHARRLAALAAGAASHIASGKGIMIFNEIPEGHKIYADPDLFVEVLHNLVSNAVKFSEQDDIVMIFVPEGRPNVIAVKDTGVGIKGTDLDRIFRHDEKTSTTGTAGESGSGFGLPLCADIMKAQGGLLSVESRPDKGSVFFAETPAVRPLVLLVEGDDTTRMTLNNQLKGLDATVIEANSGEEALAIMAEAKPHLVITDTMTSVSGGRYLLQRLKEDLETKDVPVIAITQEGDILSLEKMKTLGADDFLEKTNTEKELLKTTRKYV